MAAGFGFESHRLRPDLINKGRAAGIVDGVIVGGGALPKLPPKTGGGPDFRDVNVGGYHLTPRARDMLEKALRAKTPKEIADLRRELAAERQKFRGLDKPFAERGRGPARTNEELLRREQERREKLDEQQTAALSRIIEMRALGKGIESLSPAERRKRVREIIKTLDDRNAISRARGSGRYTLPRYLKKDEYRQD